MSVQIINSKAKAVVLKKSKKNNDEFDFLPQMTSNEDVIAAIKIAGYSYDPKQDIFISVIDPWQRDVGYCRLYDIAAAPLSMIIDCEPIYFEYHGKKWMFGFWKGQYGLVTGGEIGVYSEALNLTIPGLFGGTFYNSANDDDCMQMSFTLKKNDKTLFTREDKHWWLTGFKLGEFSEPSELKMDITITFNDLVMRDAFLSGLKKAGYSDNRLTINGPLVSFTFDKPLTPQPFTRTSGTDWIIQRKNKILCDSYQEITRTSNTIEDKVRALEEQDPSMYRKVMNVGKAQHPYEALILALIIGTLLLAWLTLKKEQD